MRYEQEIRAWSVLLVPVLVEAWVVCFGWRDARRRLYGWMGISSADGWIYEGRRANRRGLEMGVGRGRATTHTRTHARLRTGDQPTSYGYFEGSEVIVRARRTGSSFTLAGLPWDGGNDGVGFAGQEGIDSQQAGGLGGAVWVCSICCDEYPISVFTCPPDPVKDDRCWAQKLGPPKHHSAGTGYLQVFLASHPSTTCGPASSCCQP